MGRTQCELLAGIKICTPNFATKERKSIPGPNVIVQFRVSIGLWTQTCPQNSSAKSLTWLAQHFRLQTIRTRLSHASHPCGRTPVPAPAATFESRSHVEAIGTGDMATSPVEFYVDHTQIKCLRGARSWGAAGALGRAGGGKSEPYTRATTNEPATSQRI